MNRREVIGALAALTTTGVAGAQESTSAPGALPAPATGRGNLITDVDGLRVGQAQD